MTSKRAVIVESEAGGTSRAQTIYLRDMDTYLREEQERLGGQLQAFHIFFTREAYDEWFGGGGKQWDEWVDPNGDLIPVGVEGIRADSV